MTSGQCSAPGPFGRFHHVGIVVADLEVVAENVCLLLAGKVVDRGHDADLSVSWLWIASPGNPIIEFLAPSGPDGPIARYLEKRGPGLHHLSFTPVDLDSAIRHTRRFCPHVIGENRDHDGHEEFFVDPRATGGALFHAFRRLGPALDTEHPPDGL